MDASGYEGWAYDDIEEAHENPATASWYYIDYEVFHCRRCNNEWQISRGTRRPGEDEVAPGTDPRSWTVPGEPLEVTTSGVVELGPFEFEWWQAGTEAFDRGWQCEVRSSKGSCQLRHGVGAREVYGRRRVHTVTWLDDEPMVEGVEADDFERSGGLLSLIRGHDRREPRVVDQVPKEYAGLEVVSHRQEIAAPFSHDTLALKIETDDLEGWARAAILRRTIKQSWSGQR